MTTEHGTDRPVGLLVIGSGPAGVGAARGYREAGGQGQVVVVSADTDEPYERPPLSKDELVGPEVATRTPLLPGLHEDVVLRLGATVTALDLGARTARIGEEQLVWERLVLAVGMGPRTLPVVEPGAEVHLLRTLEDARQLSRAARRARTAVVIGSGFIGCEAAASLALRGLDVTLVTPEDGPQAERLGSFAARRVTGWLTELGVELRTGTTVTGLQAPRTVHLDDGTTLAPDLIVAAVGVEPATDFLHGSGLQLHEGRVVTDDQLQATDGVWAAGDCARSHHHLAGRPLDVEHWGDAIAMGELAGANAAAGDEAQGQRWRSVPGFWSTIGRHTLKYTAWGDGHAREEVVEGPGRFTVWYADDQDTLVGALTYNADDDYDRAEDLIADGAPLSEALGS